MKELVFRNSGWLAAACTLLIFLLCATPGQYIPSASWLDLLSFDKFVHATMFFTLTSLWCLYASRHKSRLYVLILLSCVLYGGLLEIMQAKCFSNRSADWNDFIANSVGCLVALWTRRKLVCYFSPPSNEEGIAQSANKPSE